MNRLLVSIFVCAAIAAAQDKTNGVTVPLSDPAQPATVKARLVSGSITVTVGSDPQVVVDTDSSSGTGVNTAPDGAPPGLHRIDTAGRGFKVEEDRNTVVIGPERAGQ